MQVEGLLALFAQRLALQAPAAAAAVGVVAADTPLSSMASAAAGRPPPAYALHVGVSERRTYRVPPPALPGAARSGAHAYHMHALCMLMTAAGWLLCSMRALQASRNCRN